MPTAWAQHVDWKKLLDQDNSGNEAVVDATRDKVLMQVLPKLCEEDAASAAAEIPGLALELSRPEDRIRLDASAILFAIAVGRRDSAIVLAQAFPALHKQAHDPVERIRRNVVRVLASLQPEIPDRELSFLVELAASSDEAMATEATSSVATMTAKRPNAADAVDQILTRSNSASLILAALQGISITRVANPKIVGHLGTVLTNGDAEVVKASLKCIGLLGTPAIRENHSQIKSIASSSENPEIRTLAEKLLSREQTKP